MKREDKFYVVDETTGERIGPFGRRATRDRALARHIKTGHFVSVTPAVKKTKSQYDETVACCMDGRFLVEVPHDLEGNSLPCEPWIPGETDDLGTN